MEIKGLNSITFEDIEKFTSQNGVISLPDFPNFQYLDFLKSIKKRGCLVFEKDFQNPYIVFEDGKILSVEDFIKQIKNDTANLTGEKVQEYFDSILLGFQPALNMTKDEFEKYFVKAEKKPVYQGGKTFYIYESDELLYPSLDIKGGISKKIEKLVNNSKLQPTGIYGDYNLYQYKGRSYILTPRGAEEIKKQQFKVSKEDIDNKKDNLKLISELTCLYDVDVLGKKGINLIDIEKMPKNVEKFIKGKYMALLAKNSKYKLFVGKKEIKNTSNKKATTSSTTPKNPTSKSQKQQASKSKTSNKQNTQSKTTGKKSAKLSVNDIVAGPSFVTNGEGVRAGYQNAQAQTFSQSSSQTSAPTSALSSTSSPAQKKKSSTTKKAANSNNAKTTTQTTSTKTAKSNEKKSSPIKQGQNDDLWMDRDDEFNYVKDIEAMEYFKEAMEDLKNEKKIEDAQKEVEELNSTIKEAQEKIEKAQEKIEKAQEEIDKLQEKREEYRKEREEQGRGL